MPLVDYPPSESDSEAQGESVSTPSEPRAKRRRGNSSLPGPDHVVPPSSAGSRTEPGLPPLPPSFHDLYASTVRRSVHDDPSLHQGRKRQLPHVVGNWPTHVYIEWHPSRAQYDLLADLMRRAREMLRRRGKQLHDFLASDLGTPLPLHISLSRPIALDTAHKDDYLERLSAAIQAHATGSFAVRPTALVWFQSPDSDRTFLVLRVHSASGEALRKDEAAAPLRTMSWNPELTALLSACNDVARRFDQPILYTSSSHTTGDAGSSSSSSGRGRSSSGSSGNGGGTTTSRDKSVEDAFHVSVGWTFGLSTDDESAVRALRLFDDDRFRQMRAWEIEVSGVKVKIGNVVSHVSLSSRKPSRSLFGI